jgi:hypothetical protein
VGIALDPQLIRPDARHGLWLDAQLDPLLAAPLIDPSNLINFSQIAGFDGDGFLPRPAPQHPGDSAVAAPKTHPVRTDVLPNRLPHGAGAERAPPLPFGDFAPPPAFGDWYGRPARRSNADEFAYEAPGYPQAFRGRDGHKANPEPIYQ